MWLLWSFLIVIDRHCKNEKAQNCHKIANKVSESAKLSGKSLGAGRCKPLQPRETIWSLPLPGMSIYSTSKFALRGYSLPIANELKQYSIHHRHRPVRSGHTTGGTLQAHRPGSIDLHRAAANDGASRPRRCRSRSGEAFHGNHAPTHARPAGQDRRQFSCVAQGLAGSMTRTGLRNQARMK